MEKFPHLKFIQKIKGTPRLFGGGKAHPISKKNKANRQGHSRVLSQKTTKIKGDWANAYFARKRKKLAKLDADIIPVFLKINPDLLNDVGFDLEKFSIEIISEENDYVIGASLDNLQTLEDKINGFITNVHGTAQIADFWEIIDGDRKEWKPQYILSEGLLSQWDNIKDDELYKVEVSIAFDKPLGKEPDRNKQGGQARWEKFMQKCLERDNLKIERENHFESFIDFYGEIISGYVDLEDSFACEVRISGVGFKDLVINYPFVFEVAEIEDVIGVDGSYGREPDSELEILAPDFDAPVIGVIDSGIMENHKYIAPAIEQGSSKSYINGDNSTADLVKGGGHGTKVAGAILYKDGISDLISPYQLPCFVRSIRVLDNDNKLVDAFPAELMQNIVKENFDCSVFNMSINSKGTFRKKHMSSWAATIDSLIHSDDIIFIISAGNISLPDIRAYLRSGVEYPDYLQKLYCGVSNPAQSNFALVVGSVNHAHFEDDVFKSLGEENDISAFSRIGTGIWGEIKPDVVEFGGGLIASKNGDNIVKGSKFTSPELIRSTLHGGGAICKDSFGTSFATPKVAHIVAQLQKIYPDENVNLLRAFVVQGARLPNGHFMNPSIESIRYFGYGIPSIDRVTKNTENRITFYNTGSLTVDDGHVYSLAIPEELRNQADEYDILIEVTLAYTSKVRRTRQKTKSYLATWLDWTNSKMDETYDDFKDYALKEADFRKNKYDKDARKALASFPWKIGDRTNHGIEGLSRNNSSVQKDWAILPSYQLPAEISFAVRAHKGWDKNPEEVPYALVISIEVLNANLPIYEKIRIENEIEISV